MLWYHHTAVSGNNAISHQERLLLWSSWSLQVSPTKYLSDIWLPNLTLSHHIVFEEVVNNTLISSQGLSELIICYIVDTVPCCVVDNHNWVLPFIMSYYKHHQQPLRMIHIDQHADMEHANKKLYPHLSYNDMWQYAIHHTTVGSRIQPLIESNIIHTVHQVRSNYALEQLLFWNINAQPYWLDIDIDFWMPEVWYNEYELDNHTKIISRLVRWAMGVSIATSPYFIQQHIAHNIIKTIFREFSI